MNAAAGRAWRRRVVRCLARATRLAAVVALFSGLAAAADAQVRQTYFDQPAAVRLPDTFREGFAYSVLVILPATNLTAAHQYERLFASIDLSEFIVLLPQGTPRSDHYLPNFGAFVEWYEERVMADLAALRRQYWTRTDRVFLTGFSLGGDLSWALSVRNPGVFAGAVMIGTRCSYPVGADALATLRSAGYRAAFVIGSNEIAARYDGINAARRVIDGAGMATLYREVEGEHANATVSVMAETFAFVVNEG